LSVDADAKMPLLLCQVFVADVVFLFGIA